MSGVDDEPYGQDLPRLDYSDYTVGWICALPLEMAAACVMLDSTHESLPIDTIDTNTYTYGSIGHHNVVLACLGRYGTNNAAHVASNMNRTFPGLQIRLLVGIGGGVPTQIENCDMRLGDIVVGHEVTQFDRGKLLSDGILHRTHLRDYPHPKLLNAVSALRARHEMHPSKALAISKEALSENSRMRDRYTLPEKVEDLLFEAHYDHCGDSTCKGCDRRMLIARPRRATPDPEVHHGAIGSGNQVIKNGTLRDVMAGELNVICFEMEAAGLLRENQALVIRGICDYSDSHKNKIWQKHAALMAAAYTKELLEVISVAKPSTALRMNDYEFGFLGRAAPSLSTKERMESFMGSKGGSLQRKLSTQDRKDLMEAIKFAEIGSREADVRPAHHQTCVWVLIHPEYLLWRDEEKLKHHRGVLWVSGKPGSGKSTMMKFLWEHEKSRLITSGSVVLSFFFNARGFTLQKTVEGMHRSLLHQLLTACPQLQVVLDSVAFPKTCPSLSILQGFLKDAILRLGSTNITIFIDAVDECTRSEVRDMVDFFEQLGQEATEKDIPLRICFSSRHYPYIHIRHGLKLTLEAQEDHESDLKTYLDARLLFNMDRSFPDIRAQILRKAAGVFLWVVLVVDILNGVWQQGFMFAVHETLQQLPGELGDLFRSILNRDSENMEHFRLSVQWILYSERPLSLKEFYYAVCSGLSRDVARSSIIVSAGVDDMHRFAISSAKGLIEVIQFEKNESTTPVVRFIHESVRDFLVDYHGLTEVFPELENYGMELGHKTLQGCCATYMGIINELLDTSSTFPIDRLYHDYPFLRYAVHNIFHHANLTSDPSSQRQFLEEISLDTWISRNSLLKKSDYTDALDTPCVLIRKGASLMYVLASVDTPALIRSGHFKNMQLNETENQVFSHAIIAANEKGHSEALKALLELNDFITPECLSFNYVRNNRHTVQRMGRGHTKERPLGWATVHGYIELTRCFLANGADVNALSHGRLPISLAVLEGHRGVVKTLLDHGADPNKTDKAGDTALSAAVEMNDIEMMKLLLQRGAQVSAYSGEWKTLLHYAAFNCSSETMELLLDNSEAESLNALDGQHMTPLHMASRSQTRHSSDIVRLLRARGANPTIVDIHDGHVLGRKVPKVKKSSRNKGSRDSTASVSPLPVLAKTLWENTEHLRSPITTGHGNPFHNTIYMDQFMSDREERDAHQLHDVSDGSVSDGSSIDFEEITGLRNGFRA